MIKAENKKNLVILISGTGTNMSAVISACKNGVINADVAAVISSNAAAPGLVKARNEGIKTHVCSLGDFGGDSFKRDQEILTVLRQCRADFVVLAGYLGIVGAEIVKSYPSRIINIHPSLLPKYGGRGCFGINVHRMVIESGDRKSGATVHFVDSSVDTGEIIKSRSLDVLAGDTPETLQKRILNEIEPFLLVEVLSQLCK